MFPKMFSVKSSRTLRDIRCKLRNLKSSSSCNSPCRTRTDSFNDRQTQTTAIGHSHSKLMRSIRNIRSTSRSFLQPVTLLLRLVKLAVPPFRQPSSRLIHNWSQQLNIWRGTFIKINISSYCFLWKTLLCHLVKLDKEHFTILTP